jgi:pyridoxamine 5'-phosphate oxidase
MLDETTVLENPFDQCRQWMREGQHDQEAYPDAMALATAAADGSPSVRMVLLKEIDDRGFIFYTNYESQKGKELLENPRAALLFFWPAQERQLRIEGIVERIEKIKSERYFATRSRESQLSAWASKQSAVLDCRRTLDEEYQSSRERYAGKSVPMPDYWGGYRVLPEQFEFWQGRPGRLHDRIRYRKDHRMWKIERLSP